MHHRIVSTLSSFPRSLAILCQYCRADAVILEHDLNLDRKKPTFSLYWLNGCLSSKRVRGRVGSI
jgi:hypothetical protein